MGNSKLKWSPEEEKALREGVNKHGVSKWKIILKDPQFHHILSSRSNIDLKDKWRNMNHAKSRLKPKPKPKPSIQDQKSTEAGRLKMEKEEKVSSSSEEMEEGILAELIAELGNTNNDPEHEQYCKDLELLLADDENADEILAYANQIMDPPFDNYDFSDL